MNHPSRRSFIPLAAKCQETETRRLLLEHIAKINALAKEAIESDRRDYLRRRYEEITSGAVYQRGPAGEIIKIMPAC